MDYEFAKQLKDAGFPQPETPEVGREYFDEDGGLHSFSEEEWDATNIPVETSAKNRREKNRLLSEYSSGCLIPTLEELIEACPRTRDSEMGWTGLFSLAYLNEKWLAGYEKYEMFDPECWGATPTEAVARLWLALHANGDASA